MNECVIRFDKLFGFIKICQKASCCTYIMFWCLASCFTQNSIYNFNQVISRHRQAKDVHNTRVKMNFSFSKAHKMRDFNRTIRETLLKLPVDHLNETSNLLSLNDEQKKIIFSRRKIRNSVFSHFCFSSHISFRFNCNVPTFILLIFVEKISLRLYMLGDCSACTAQLM